MIHSQEAIVCPSPKVTDEVVDDMETISNRIQSKISAARGDSPRFSASCRNVVVYGSKGLLNSVGYVEGMNISSSFATCESCT